MTDDVSKLRMYRGSKKKKIKEEFITSRDMNLAGLYINSELPRSVYIPICSSQAASAYKYAN